MLQAFIPAGFMPRFDNNTMTIEICSGLSGEMIEVDVEGDKSSPDTPQSKSKCPFSILTSYTLTNTADILKSDFGFENIPVLYQDRFTAFFRNTSPYKRGPPDISFI
jgi:hypothetical protein